MSLFTVGFFCTTVSTRFSRNIYESKKTNLERILKRTLNKNFDLGEFSDLRFFGFSVLNTKIEDIEIPDSKIEAEHMYIRFMPIRSFLNREWVFSLNPNKLKAEIREDFFLRRRKIINSSKINRRKFNYEVHLNLKNNSILNINNLGIKGNIGGNLIYRSSRNQLITFLNANLKEKGNLRLKINRKFNNQFFSLNLKTNDLNLKDVKYKLINEELNFNKGFIKSNFKFIKSPDKNYCNGNISITNLNLFTNKLNKNINSKLFNLNCNDNKLSMEGNQLNYGTLTSNLYLDVPLNNVQNNISFKGDIGFKKNPKPVITYEGDIPYWYNNKGFNFGNLSSNINLNRTKLDNLNIFRNNGISGFITAKGNLSGNLKNINTLINFNIEYPTYKGVRIKETFDGKIENKENGYLLKLTPRESVIPTFLSINFDQNFKLDKLNLSRTLYPDTGNLNIFKNNNYYQWRADKFNLKKLELSILDNDYEWVEGEINGAGFISRDFTNFDGSISLKDGKYRNINFTESIIKFVQNVDSLNLETLLKTNDGGQIEIIYKSDEYDFIKAKLNNVSSKWTAITAFDLIDFKKNNSISQENFGSVIDLEIKNNQKTLDERIKFLNNFNKKKKFSNKKKRLNNFIDKFEGFYSGEINLSGTDSSNYEIEANLNGFLKEKNDFDKNIKNNFSINLKGGLMENQGKLLSKFPLSIANLFFKEPKKFSGNLNLSLDYDLNDGSFLSDISSNELLFEDLKIDIEKSDISFKDYNLVVNSSLLIDNKGSKIDIKGQINNIGNKENKIKELNLRLDGNEKFLDLIASLSGQTFNYKDGEVDFIIKFTGSLDKPLAYGFLQINNGEIQVLKNNLKNLETKMFFEKNVFTVDDFKALDDDSGELSLKGSIPFYKENEKENKQIDLKSKNLKFKRNTIDFQIDSNISVAGSIENPQIGGQIEFKKGFIDFKSNGNNNDSNSKNYKKDIVKQNPNMWPEINWDKEKQIDIVSNGSLSEDQIGLDLGKLIRKKTPDYLSNLIFKDFKIKLGPDLKIGYGNIFRAYLDNLQEEKSLLINGNPKLSSLDKSGLNAHGDIKITKGYANLYTTPFKLDKKPNKKQDKDEEKNQKPNTIRFSPTNGVNPRLNFYLKSKVPDSIIPISDNNMDINNSEDTDSQESNNDFGTFGIGNTRFIKVEAFYDGLLNQVSFEDQNQYLKFRSTPNYSRSEIIRLISGNSANLINRIFTSQLSGSDGFNERFQLSLYPALIEDNESINKIFSNENINLNDTNAEEFVNDGSSSQAWITELGLEINEYLNFSMQATPNREDIPPLWSLTLKANQNLELLGSYDSNGGWKSQLQLFIRY